MSLRVCCSQVLLVPAVHVPHSAVLHLLWGRLCGHHPQPHGCRHPLWSLLRPHESLCWLCHSPARVPRLVDLGKTIILLFACYHTSLRQRSYLPSQSLTHSLTHLFIDSFNMHLCCQFAHGQLHWLVDLVLPVFVLSQNCLSRWLSKLVGLGCIPAAVMAAACMASTQGMTCRQQQCAACSAALGQHAHVVCCNGPCCYNGLCCCNGLCCRPIRLAQLTCLTQLHLSHTYLCCRCIT